MIRLAAGIDIGGTNIAFGLVDDAGKIRIRDSIKTQTISEAPQLAETVSQQILAAMKNMGNDFELIGAGIGVPNGNRERGTIEFAPNLKWKGVIPLAKYFSDALNVKTILDNDANAAAFGEMIYGGAKEIKDFIFITLGTGLGSGIVVNGKMVYGHQSFAGEIGHVVLIPDGRQCGCGRKGCVETYCSASGIVKTYLEKNTEIRNQKSEIDARYIFEKARQGEQVAIDSFNYTGELLGLVLANSCAYTNPEAIFLFGGLANAGDFIFKPTIESFEKNLLNIYKGKVKILPSQLNETDAAILGAASMVWEEEKS